MTNDEKRQVLVVRHAQASSSERGIDKKRKLTEQGLECATRLGEKIKDSGFKPEAIFCSSATRAIETMDTIVASANVDMVSPAIEDKYYQATSGTWLEVLQGLDSSVKQAMVIGHEPTMSALVGPFADKYLKFRPGAAYMLIFMGSWDRLIDSDVSVVEFFEAIPS